MDELEQLPLDRLLELGEAAVDAAILEDLRGGDPTTEALFDRSTRIHAVLLAKEKGVLAGIPVAERAFHAPDAVLACGRAVHLTHELTQAPFRLNPNFPPTSISIRLSLEMHASHGCSVKVRSLHFGPYSDLGLVFVFGIPSSPSQTPSKRQSPSPCLVYGRRACCA
jgi:hypothetical protein